jgi:hypothetical protein
MCPICQSLRQAAVANLMECGFRARVAEPEKFIAGPIRITRAVHFAEPRFLFASN